MTRDITAFPPGIAEKLKTYVYRLIDPRNGETFYVGKGQGNRIFAHIREQVEEDDPNNKLRRIRDIRLSGFDVAHVIHRHGMDATTALEVEAALLDAYPGLTNIAGGFGSDFGVMHVSEIVERYGAPPAVFKHRAMLITVNRSAAEVSSLYEATHYAWKVSPKNARQAEVVLAVLQGLIVGAFTPREWLPATSENFPEHEDAPGRFGFIGELASRELRELYERKRVPDEYRKKGSANPIKYVKPVHDAGD
jgi:hypothetical protein